MAGFRSCGRVVAGFVGVVCLIFAFFANYSPRTSPAHSFETAKMKFDYPKPRRDDSVVDDLHGVKVADPYRWMEDPDAEETKAFVDAQNDISMPFLEKCAIRDKLHERIKEMWDYPKYGCPKKHGPRYFYFHNTGLQNQSVMYVQDAIDGEPRVFLNPNLLSEDGTVAISSTTFTEDGLFFAYSVSKAGSDWVTIKFKDVATGEDLEDTLEHCKFTSMAWTHDNKGFFYNRYPADGDSVGTNTAANVDQKLYYHTMGQKQDQDVLVAEWPDEPKWMTGAEVSDCGHYLIVTLSHGCDPVNHLYFVDLRTLKDGINGILPFVKVVENFEAEYSYVTNEGSVFTFKTNLNAPMYKLINIDFNDYSQEKWVTLVEENEKDVLDWAACVNENVLVLCYMQDVKNVLYIHDLATGARKETLPLNIGTVVGFSGKKQHSEIFYKFMSFLEPGTIYRCDFSQPGYKPTVFRDIPVKGLDASIFEVKQVFYPSEDGTKVPMFIVHKKGIELDSSHPVLLYGYGGFNIAITPTFSVSRIVFMNHLGGILAVPSIRGGGEYGEIWHKAGKYEKKQNVFDDFQAAAKYMIAAKYTSAKRVIMNGGSNGGLLVAACTNQRPDLIGVVINQVGVMDMLRFQKFTIGHAWMTEFGNPDKKEDFEYLYKYSPLHNIKEPEGDAQFPSTLLLTADHDDRVSPLHSLKYIAEMQNVIRNSTKQTNPLLIRVDTKAGHGAGKPTAKVIEEVRDIYCFITEALKLEWHDSLKQQAQAGN